jgi:hypothetical protein
MMFYDDDSSVRTIYQRFYMLGTEGINWTPMTQSQNGMTLTGGANQKNDSHYIELLAACAALDFYNADTEPLQQNKANYKTDYLYRAIDDSGRFDFQDFVGKERQEEFAKKFGLLIAFGLFNNGTDDFVESVRSGGVKEVTGFDGIDPLQVESLKKYFRLFFVRKKEDGSLEEGWLRQLHRSAGGGDKFLFNAKLFAPQTMKELMKLSWNKDLYRKDGIGKDNNYSTGLLGTKFNSFKNEFLKHLHDEDSQNITNRGEQLYKLIYDTLCVLYQFN